MTGKAAKTSPCLVEVPFLAVASGQRLPPWKEEQLEQELEELYNIINRIEWPLPLQLAQDENARMFKLLLCRAIADLANMLNAERAAQDRSKINESAKKIRKKMQALAKELSFFKRSVSTLDDLNFQGAVQSALSRDITFKEFMYFKDMCDELTSGSRVSVRRLSDEAYDMFVVGVAKAAKLIGMEEATARRDLHTWPDGTPSPFVVLMSAINAALPAEWRLPESSSAPGWSAQIAKRLKRGRNLVNARRAKAQKVSDPFQIKNGDK